MSKRHSFSTVPIGIVFVLKGNALKDTSIADKGIIVVLQGIAFVLQGIAFVLKGILFVLKG